MSFPDFSNISGYALKRIESRAEDTFNTSKLNCFIRISSGANCVLYSNPNLPLFSAAGDNNAATIYGNKTQSGVIGVTWDGKTAITCGPGTPGRPSPIVTSLEIDEGAGELSRKAKFTIRCFSVEQLNLIMAYYMEPAFTCFIEFGWNTVGGVKKLNKLDAESIASYQSITAVEKFRKSTDGQADVYLGFITGGSVSVSDTYWDVNVKVSGFSELPAYLMAADNQRNKGETNPADGTGPKPDVEDYSVDSWWDQEDLPWARWMMAFNALPSNKKTKIVKALEGNTNIRNPINFINFDPKVQNAINTKKDGGFWGNIFGNDDDATIVDPDTGEKIEIELGDGVKLIGEERFIRFEALHTIINRLENKNYLVNKTIIPFKIDSSRTICSAFDNMFSTDRTKLFIPNSKTPGPSFYEIASGATSSTKTDWVDNTVKYGGRSVAFPNEGKISDSKATNVWGNVVDIYYSYDTSTKFNKAERTWGFLNDLYINLDFAKGILETKNFLIKDALYQILNAISAAAGGMWDFQIVEVPNPLTGIMELMIVELNCINNKPEPEKIATFHLSGTKSVFLEASFDMDIGGAMMNQVIGEKNKKSLNASSPSAQGNLFSRNIEDKVGVKIQEEAEKGREKWADGTSKNDLTPEGQNADEGYKEQVKEQFAAFLGKVCLVPHVDVLAKDAAWTDEPYKKNYMAAYDDQAWFESFKIGAESSAKGEVSVLLPIKFTFTVHGVSGIKRGDKFIVLGLPQQYSTAGFFQVTGVKQTISGMLWKTEVIGQFRQIR